MKKKLLLICRDIPADSGSTENIRLFRMIDLLREKFVISVISESADYGLTPLRSSGVGVIVDYDLTHFESNFHKIQPDYVIISRWTYAQRCIDMIRNISNVRIVIDVPVISFIQLEQRLDLKDDSFTEEEITDFRRQEIETYNKADACIVSCFKDKEIIDTLVDKPIHVAYHLYELPDEKRDLSIVNRNHMYFIGDFTYAANEDAINWLYNEIMPKIAKVNKDVKLYVIGSKIPSYVQNNENVEVCNFMSDIYAHLRLMNICLMPLRIISGMIGKVCEAMSMGIPIVMTKSVADQLKELNIQHLKNVIVTNGTDSFAESVLKLINSTDTIYILSKNAKETIAANFNANDIKQVIYEALDLNQQKHTDIANSYLCKAENANGVGSFDEKPKLKIKNKKRKKRGKISRI